MHWAALIWQRRERLARYLLAVAFVGAAAAKVLPVVQPSPLPHVGRWSLSVVEFALAIVLVAKPRDRWPLAAGAVLLIAFTLYLAAFGDSLPKGGCGCFGPLRLAVWQHLALNGSLILLAGIAIRHGASQGLEQ